MRSRPGDGLLLVLLLVAYGWLFVFFPGINNPNELVRVYAARALVEEHTWSIGRRDLHGGVLADGGPVYSDWGYVNDKALACDDPRAHPPACAGRLFAAKAPGASLLAAPVLAVLRASGPLRKTEAVFALRWVWVIVPSVLFWIALRRWMLDSGVPEPAALACTLCGALGSLSLTYGQMFAGHQLAALALGAAFLCAFWKTWRPAWFGFFCALSVALEYPSAPAAALLFAAAMLQHRRGLWRAALGALPWALLLAQFHWSAFGAPWATPYGHLENPGFVRDMGPNLFGFSMPTVERLYGSFLAPWLGLFFWAPWTALALLAPLWLRRSLPGWAAFAVIAYYVVFQLAQSLWRSGWVVGPRYITPLVPFAAICVALAARSAPRWWPTALRGLGAAGISATGLASAVCQGFPLEVENPLREVVWPLLSHGYAAPNLLQRTGVPGLWSAAPYFLALAIGIALLVRRNAAALAVWLAVSAAQWAAPARNDLGAARFLASQWEPAPPPGASPF
ncbi:MAG TPA: hypothetical protein VFL36_21585 [Myxococcales bacterium]|nr:hypothetical protein [Myxococcales bacterium]